MCYRVFVTRGAYSRLWYAGFRSQSHCRSSQRALGGGAKQAFPARNRVGANHHGLEHEINTPSSQANLPGYWDILMRSGEINTFVFGRTSIIL